MPREGAGTGLEERCAMAERLMTQLFEEYEASGKEPDWQILRGLPGVRLEPTTWGELTAIINDGSAEALSRLGRYPRDLHTYRHYRNTIITPTWASVTDYLHVKVFGLDAYANADGKLVAAMPSDFSSKQCIVWRFNDFPYHVEEGVEHHCLWASVPPTHAQLQAEVAARRQGYEWTYFINPPSLMSVPQIFHAHILSRKK